MSKPRVRKNPDRDFQKYLTNIQFGDDERKSLSQLKRLAKELGADYDFQEKEQTVDKGPNIKTATDALKWFRAKITSLVKSPWEVTKNIIGGIFGRGRIGKVTMNDAGKMVSFVYDPKHKDTLPYYDIFPLVILLGPSQKVPNSFIGLNLHYIPPKQRKILIDKLLETVTNDKIDDRTKVNISYQILKSATKYRLFKPCIKMYLNSHLKSTIKLIPFSEWANSILLPTANFKKASIVEVWADSLKIARTM